MKKLFALMLALLLILSGLGSAMAEDTSLQAILDKGKFILGFDSGFPPMGYVDDATGAYVGFDLDVAKEVCARLGVELVLQPIDWAAKDMELNGGGIDCIWNGMTVTPEREEGMALSYHYLQNAQVVAVLASSPYQSFADLAGKDISIQAGSSAEEALDSAVEFKASLASVNPYADNTMALLDLDNGTVAATALDLIVADPSTPMRPLTEPEGNAVGRISFHAGDR